MSWTTMTVTIVTDECWVCGVPFGLSKEYKDDIVKRGKSFWCPNGHKLCYVTETEEDRLRKRVERLENRNHGLQSDLESAGRRAAALRGVVTRTKRRIAKGKCPACRKSFPDLADHMGQAHPEWEAPDA